MTQYMMGMVQSGCWALFDDTDRLTKGKHCPQIILFLFCTKSTISFYMNHDIIEPRHEISNNVVCVTSKASDQPAHTRSLIKAFASRLNILFVLSLSLSFYA